MLRVLVLLAALLLTATYAQIPPWLSNPPIGPGSLVPIGPSISSSNSPPSSNALLANTGQPIYSIGTTPILVQ